MNVTLPPQPEPGESWEMSTWLLAVAWLWENHPRTNPFLSAAGEN